MRLKMRALSFLCLLIVLSMVSFSFVGGYCIIQEYPSGAYTGDYGNYPTVVHPSSTSAVSAVYQSFKTNLDNTNLSQVDVWLSKVSGSPVGFLRLSVYTHTGSYGSTGTPNVLLESAITDLQMSGVSASGAMYPFYFTNLTVLTGGTAYCWVLSEVNETTCDTSNNVRVGIDSAASGGGASGCVGYYSNSAWSSGTANYDALYVVYGEGGTGAGYVDGNVYVYNYTNNFDVSAGDVLADGSVTASGDITSNGAITSSGAITSNGAVSAGAVSAGAVTAGDVTAGAVTAGDVTAEGSFSAEFNNTVVNAGDVLADGNVTATGAVSAGDVDATNLIVLQGEGGASGSVPLTFIVAVLLLVVNGILIFIPKLPILNFVVGLPSIVIGLMLFSDTNVPFQPYFSLICFTVAIISFVSAILSFRSEGE